MLTRQTHDFARAVVVFDAVRHVQHTGGNAHAQCLEHRVAADHQIVGVRREMCGATACGQSRIGALAFLGLLLRLVRLMVDTVLGLRGGALAAQGITMFAARPLVGPFLVTMRSFSQHPLSRIGEKTRGCTPYSLTGKGLRRGIWNNGNR